MPIKKILNILLAAGFLLVPVIAICCSCGGMERSLKENVERSNFVAYVKILRKETLSEADYGRLKSDYRDLYTRKLVYQVKEMFKGDSTFFLYEGGIGTSCDMGISEGSEWIFFGDGKEAATTSVSYCGKWIRMRDGDGQQWYSYNNGIQTLKDLRELMHLPAKPKKNGKEIFFYANGKKESESFYKDDKLDKKQVLYYSDGTIRSINHFKNGKLDGQQQEFAVSGQLLSETWCIENEWISRKEWYDTSFAERRWYLLFTMDRLPNGREDLDTMLNRYIIPIQLSMDYVYDVIEKKGTTKKYKWNGLLLEILMYDKSNSNSLTYKYHPNGNISDEILYRKSDDWSEEKSWDINGKLIKHKTWLKGKYLGDQVQQ